MKELIAIPEDVGSRNVKTCILSGNVVFRSGRKNTSRVSGELRDQIRKSCGFEPAVTLLSLEDSVCVFMNLARTSTRRKKKKRVFPHCFGD